MDEPNDDKRYCLKCIDTPGWVYIKDPRQQELVKMKCPSGCHWKIENKTL